MAKIIEEKIVIKFTKLVPNSSSDMSVLTKEQLQTLIQSIPELAESILNSSAIIVETLEYDELDG